MGTKYFSEIPGYATAHAPFSHAVVANGFVFVSGQAAVRPGGDGPLDLVGSTTVEQTRQALKNVDLVLRSVGSSIERVVKVTVLLSRPDEYKEMNAVYAEFFPTNKPARSIAQLGANVPGVLVSVEAIATLEEPA